MFLTALADADAMLGRAGETPVVVEELEVGLDLVRVIMRPKPEVLTGQVAVNHLVRVHLVGGVHFKGAWTTPQRPLAAYRSDAGSVSGRSEPRQRPTTIPLSTGDRQSFLTVLYAYNFHAKTAPPQ